MAHLRKESITDVQHLLLMRLKLIQLLQHTLRLIVQLFPRSSNLLLLGSLGLNSITLLKHFLINNLVQPSILLISVVFFGWRMTDEFVEERGPFGVELVAHCLDFAEGCGGVGAGRLDGGCGGTG